MKSISKIAPVILLAVVFAVSTCKKDEQTTDLSGDVPLTEEQDAFLASLPDTTIQLEDIMLDDGQNVRSFLEKYDPDFLTRYPSGKKSVKTDLTPREQKNLFCARMVAAGNYLADRSKHTVQSEGADKPAQTGLAYLWGGKDYEHRNVPWEGTGECANLKIFGLDCSGMIWAMTQASSLPPVRPVKNFTVESISNTAAWTLAFMHSADYKNLEMKDTGQLEPDKMKTGDIILWGRHVGIYLNGHFYQSNGTSKSTDCRRNIAQDRGPRIIPLSDVVNSKKLAPYTVFRPVFFELGYHIKIDYDVENEDHVVCVEASYHDEAEFDIDISWKGDITISNRGEIFNQKPSNVEYRGVVDDEDTCQCNALSVTDEFTVTGLDTLDVGYADMYTKEVFLKIVGSGTDPGTRFDCGSGEWYYTDEHDFNIRQEFPPFLMGDSTKQTVSHKSYSSTYGVRTWTLTAIQKKN